MEIVGGFMIMTCILGFFLAAVWLVMPFVLLAVKGKMDRTLDVLAGIEKRLSFIEARLAVLQQVESHAPAISCQVPTAAEEQSAASDL